MDTDNKLVTEISGEFSILTGKANLIATTISTIIAATGDKKHLDLLFTFSADLVADEVANKSARLERELDTKSQGIADNTLAFLATNIMVIGGSPTYPHINELEQPFAKDVFNTLLYIYEASPPHGFYLVLDLLDSVFNSIICALRGEIRSAIVKEADRLDDGIKESADVINLFDSDTKTIH